MKIDSIDDVIAIRKYRLGTSPAESEVEVRIGKPVPSPEVQDGLEYICPFSISHNGKTEFHFTAGIDALQSLLLTLAYLKAHLENLSAEYSHSITWIAGEKDAVDIYLPELLKHR